ncbi:CLC_0170 family protein [Paenibacillus sp. GCM10023250]|uniref:CLC_0170 family protein n=1 Tax=Paenibacillus sp. GCM10023250 TaxID=3252648 RepID=UPI003612A0AB
MLISGYTISFVSYAAPLLLVTGFILVRFDAAGYKKRNMPTEQKLSRFLGWINVVLGVGMYVLKGVYF